LARQGPFEPDFGPLNFFSLEFGPLAKKFVQPCSRTSTTKASIPKALAHNNIECQTCLIIQLKNKLTN
jgi:hypothetical protein